MSHESFLNGRVGLCCGDSIHFLRDQPDNRYDSIVTDPPYALVSIGKRFSSDSAAAVKVPAGGSGAYARASAGFMGKKWDTGETAFAIEFWQECLRVLKPGGHVVAFGGTRTYHRLACAIEDGGFEIRDQLAWTYGSGFPKSHDISKGIDKEAGFWRGRAGAITIAEQNSKGKEYVRAEKGNPVTVLALEWDGWGTAIKPAWEPICLARKPLSEKTVVANILKWGTGAINIDGCRVAGEPWIRDNTGGKAEIYDGWGMKPNVKANETGGRWPANIVHDGSDEVLAAFPDAAGQQRYVGPEHGDRPSRGIYGDFGARPPNEPRDDGGSAARFFYTAKADADDRLGSKHPTRQARRPHAMAGPACDA